MSEPRRLSCSTGGDELLAIGAALRRAAVHALLERERLPRAVCLRFRATEEAEQAVGEFVRRERECCPFFDFAVRRAEGALTLEVAGPPEAGHLLDLIYRVAEPSA
ncbi:MAG: hypothetical protein ACRDK5_11890 [Solirubrobacterales bacterium]